MAAGWEGGGVDHRWRTRTASAFHRRHTPRHWGSRGLASGGLGALVAPRCRDRARWAAELMVPTGDLCLEMESSPPCGGSGFSGLTRNCPQGAHARGPAALTVSQEADLTAREQLQSTPPDRLVAETSQRGPGRPLPRQAGGSVGTTGCISHRGRPAVLRRPSRLGWERHVAP